MDLKELEQIIIKLSAINTPVGLIPTVGIPLFNATEELKDFYNRAVSVANETDVKEELDDGGSAEHVPADEN